MTYFDTYRSVFSVCACWSVFFFNFFLFFNICTCGYCGSVFVVYYLYVYSCFLVYLPALSSPYVFYRQHMQLTFVGNLYG